MSDLSDLELRERFGALRARDARGAPRLGGMLDRIAHAPPERSRPRARWRLALALSIAAALLLAVGLTRVARRRAFVPPPLSTWTSPTASLLRTSESTLLGPSALTSSVLDQLASTSSPHQGRQQ